MEKNESARAEASGNRDVSERQSVGASKPASASTKRSADAKTSTALLCPMSAQDVIGKSQRWTVLYTSDVVRKSKRWKDGVLESCAVPGSLARVRLQLYERTELDGSDAAAVASCENQSSSGDASLERAPRRRSRPICSETLAWTRFDCSGESFGLGERLLVRVLEPLEQDESDRDPPAEASNQQIDEARPISCSFCRNRSSADRRSVPETSKASDTLVSRRGLGASTLRKRFQIPAKKLKQDHDTNEDYPMNDGFAPCSESPTRPTWLASRIRTRPSPQRNQPGPRRRVARSSPEQRESVEAPFVHIDAGLDVASLSDRSVPFASLQPSSRAPARTGRRPNDDELLAMLETDHVVAEGLSDGALRPLQPPLPATIASDVGASPKRSSAVSREQPAREVSTLEDSQSPRRATSAHSVSFSGRRRNLAPRGREVLHPEDLPLILPKLNTTPSLGTTTAAASCRETSAQVVCQHSSAADSRRRPNSWESIAAYRQEMLYLLADQMQRSLDHQSEILRRAAEQLLDRSSNRAAFELLEVPRQDRTVLIVRRALECFATTMRKAKDTNTTKNFDSGRKCRDEHHHNGIRKYYLRFLPESDLQHFASRLARDDLWAIGTYMDWQMHGTSEREHTPPSVTLVRSLYHGTSITSGLLEVQPVGPRNNRLWRKQHVSVLAMRCAQLATEFLCLDAFLKREPFERIRALNELVGAVPPTRELPKLDTETSLSTNENKTTFEWRALSSDELCNKSQNQRETEQGSSSKLLRRIPADSALLDKTINVAQSIDDNRACAQVEKSCDENSWTAEQQQVVRACLEWLEGSFHLSKNLGSHKPRHLVALHGAFGTGKTMTLVRTILALLQRRPSLRILIAAGTNVAVDNILLGLLRHGYRDFGRAGNERRMHPLVCNFSRKRLQRVGDQHSQVLRRQKHRPSARSPEEEQRLSSASSETISEPEADSTDTRVGRKRAQPQPGSCSRPGRSILRDETMQSIPQSRCKALPTPPLRNTEAENVIRTRAFRRRAVVGVTCASATQSILQGLRFDVIIVDEASQIIEPLAMVPVLELGADHCLVLIAGDERQLPPLVPGPSSVDVVERVGMARSLLERLATLENVQNIYLTVQFRCHPQIAAIASELAYGGMIRSAPSTEAYKALVPELAPVSFVHTGGDDQTTADGSRYNRVEAHWIATFLRRLWQQGSIEPSQVGVICLYRAQVTLIEQLINSENISGPALETASTKTDLDSSHPGLAQVKVSTVDAFQGGERKLIVLSTVRTYRPDGKQTLDSLERVNVALTRASHHLIVTGHRTALASSPVWRCVLNRCAPLPPTFTW